MLKAGNKTRFIFHLSYESSKDELGRSLNGCTPKEKCTVKYNDLDTAVKQCILESEHVELVNVGQVLTGLSRKDRSFECFLCATYASRLFSMACPNGRGSKRPKN